jgi:hypothetical protein
LSFLFPFAALNDINYSDKLMECFLSRVYVTFCPVCMKEANKMVQEANIKRMATEKKLEEANSKVVIHIALCTRIHSLEQTGQLYGKIHMFAL